MALRRRHGFAPQQSAPAQQTEERARRKAPRIGFLPPGAIERAFILLLYGTLLALVGLSVIGTFYGLASEAAPLLTPRQMYADIAGNTDRLWVALALQVFLTLGQYGARQMARHNPRWWFLYLAMLGISVYYNYQAYWVPLNEITLWPIALAGIILGDVLPEFIAVRHE